jgi:hypothetical protein
MSLLQNTLPFFADIRTTAGNHSLERSRGACLATPAVNILEYCTKQFAKQCFLLLGDSGTYEALHTVLQSDVVTKFTKFTKFTNRQKKLLEAFLLFAESFCTRNASRLLRYSLAESVEWLYESFKNSQLQQLSNIDIALDVEVDIPKVGNQAADDLHIHTDVNDDISHLQNEIEKVRKQANAYREQRDDALLTLELLQQILQQITSADFFSTP